MIDAILADVRSQGLSLALENGSLRLTGPKGLITPAILEVLKKHKQAIIARLQQDVEPEEDRPAPWFELKMSTGILLYRQHHYSILGAVAWRPLGGTNWTAFPDVEPFPEKPGPKLFRPETGEQHAT